MRTFTTVAAAALGALALAGPPVSAQAARPAESGSKPYALVGGVPITEAEVDRAAEGQLRELRLREFTLRSQALEGLIAEKLLDREAAARGVTRPALVKAEVEDKVQASEAEIRAIYETNKDKIGAMSEADALKQIESRLRSQRERERQAVFVRELRQKAAVKVLLEPLRVAVDVAGRPIRGNKDAPVTIVEFSDFQCPYCSRARPAVNKVRETYGDKVRVIFRNFPLSIHPQALKAGEAASCAAEQGKFWEMHDRLFANQAKLQVPDLKEHAAALGLDAAAFAQCLDSSRHTADVQRDVEAGTGYGVSGTPSFFINGRPLVGAQPFEGFAQVIDDELERVPPAK